MSPLDVNPLSWIYGIPFALACLSFYRLPRESRVKSELRKVFQYDSMVWSTLLSRPNDYCDHRAHRTLQTACLAAAAALGVLSGLSFLGFLLSK